MAESELVFHRRDASFPWRSDAGWLLSQMVRWRQAEDTPEALAAVRQVYRPDLCRTAARSLGFAAPETDDRPPAA